MRDQHDDRLESGAGISPARMRQTQAGVWQDFRVELKRWESNGRLATLWLRDDDAQRPSALLAQLFALSRTFDVPLSLAVIPAGVETELAHAVAGENTVTILQHGFAHRNTAPEGQKKSELDGQRPRAEVWREMSQGQAALGQLFAARFLPVLVPPWNRISSNLIGGLRQAGFQGLSTFTPRPARAAADGVLQCNCHVDIIDWRARAFAGEERVLAALTGHLRARRTGRVDASEPSGILSHHLVQDAPCWQFLERLLEECAALPAVRWVAPDWSALDSGARCTGPLQDEI